MRSFLSCCTVSLVISISCFKVHSSIGHLVCFFDSRNTIVSGGNSYVLMPVVQRKVEGILPGKEGRESSVTCTSQVDS